MARGRKPKAQVQEAPKGKGKVPEALAKANGNGEVRVEPLAHLKSRDRAKLDAILGVLKGAGYRTSDVHEGAWYRARVLPK